MADIVADSASNTDVQSAVTSASSGDRVLIPNGTATWTTPIDFGGKQIFLEAQNITPVSKPTISTVRNVRITYNGSTTGDHLIDMTSGNTFHCGVAGIEFIPNTLGDQGGSSNIYGAVHFSGSGTKPPLCWDCHFVGNNRQNVTAGNAAFLSIDSLGGVIWNCFFDGTQVDAGLGGGGGDGMGGAGVHLSSPRAWTTASTMGTLDTDGLVNVYFEDCNFDWFGQLDIDDNGRCVCRYSDLNGIGWQTHGFTSATGGRHFEGYDCNLTNSRANRNHRRHFWLRAGTCLYTDCAVSDESQGFGSLILLSYGDNVDPSGPYQVNRAPGGGHNGSAYVSDPVHLWSNTGGANTDWGLGGNAAWEDQFQLDRDIFVSADATAAKGGYSKFTYPHPLRSDQEPTGNINFSGTLTVGTLTVG